MRIDPSAIERAGQANAKANQAFGNALGEVAKGYFVGQEKKARANEIKEELMRNGVPEDAAGNISKNPFLQKEHARKEEAENRMNIARLAQRSAGDALAQKAAFEETRVGEKAKAEQSATNIAKFNLDRPDLPITEETPAAFLPELDPDPFAAPPTTYQGQAPAVAQLPERFQPQGAQVVDAVQSGKLSPLEGNRIMDSIRGQAMAVQKAAPTTKDLLEIQAKIQDMNIKDSDYGDSESIKTFTPKSNYLQLGTTKMPISGRLGNEAEAIKYKDEYIPAFNQTNAAFEKLLALGQKRADGWYMSSEDKDQALSYIKTLQGNIREDILGPGTVQESERVILDNIVKDPTKAFTLNGAAANMEILRNLRQTIFDRLENRLGNFGLKLGESKSPNSPQAKPDYTDETSTGNKIRTFDFDNTNQ
jgi:hypothetical protein